MALFLFEAFFPARARGLCGFACFRFVGRFFQHERKLSQTIRSVLRLVSGAITCEHDFACLGEAISKEREKTISHFVRQTPRREHIPAKAHFTAHFVYILSAGPGAAHIFELNFVFRNHHEKQDNRFRRFSPLNAYNSRSRR